MDYQLVHFEHAAPLLPELGLDKVFGAFASAKAQGGDLGEALGALGSLLTNLGELRTLRRLVAVARATGDELLEAEASPEAAKALERRAALCSATEAREALSGFFSWCGASLGISRVFSEALGELQGVLGQAAA